MSTGNKAVRLLAGAVSLLMIAACTGGGATTAPATTAPASGPTPSAAQPSPTASGPIVIGVINSFTGFAAQYGEYGMNGINLALKEKGSSVLGQQIQLVQEDDGCLPEGGGTAASKLVGKVIAVIGPTCSGSTATAGPILTAAQIPYFFDGFLPALTKEQGTDWIFRVVPSDTFLTARLAQDIKDQGLTKIALANDTTTYGAGEAAAFVAAWKNLGMPDVAVNVTFDSGATDFTGQVAKVKQAGVQAVVITAYETPGGLFIKQARQLGVTAALFGGLDLGNKAFTDAAGSAAEGGRFVTDFMRTDPTYADFASKYLAAYNVVVDDTASGPYLATLALIDALTRAGPGFTPTQLRDAIRATNLQTGVGLAAWDAHGDLTAPYGDLGLIQNGGPVLIQRVALAP